ncbi:MAG: 50S ribosomal protein L15 [Candidatus Dojkabacteria bacterium]
MNLPSPKSTKPKVQVGRGYGSKRGGHTTGRGTKGQKSRSGYKAPRPGFEGGQTPLSKRLPKLKNKSGASTRSRAFITSKIKNNPIQLSRLEEVFENGDIVSFETLADKKIIKPLAHKEVAVKIVFDKEISKKLSLQNLAISAKAKEAVEKAGGSVE